MRAELEFEITLRSIQAKIGDAMELMDELKSGGGRQAGQVIFLRRCLDMAMITSDKILYDTILK